MATARALVAVAVSVASILAVAFFAYSIDLPSPSSFSSSFAPPGCASASRRRPPPLKVFMYDLPPRFNVEMLGTGGGEWLPPWPPEAGIKRQHSVEYWMMASLVDGGGEGEEPAALRVLNGDEAEAFFVPFFSSLSFNTHGKNMTDPDTKFDQQLQIDLLDFLRKSKYWISSAGRDHVIPMTHPNAFRFLRDQVNASILVVADFGRYTKHIASLSKDIVAPYVHVVESLMDDDPPEPFEARPTLLFFRGRTDRKDGGKVRPKLAKILKGYEDVQFENSHSTSEGIKASMKSMKSSKFCLHPAGDTPSSCRLFDAIVSHCIPVIVSDRIELPFENTIDYSEFSLIFSMEEALQPDYLITQLRQIKKDKWIEMWRKLKNVSHHFEFQRPTKKDDAVNMIWQQVRNKLPAANLAIHRSRRLKIPDWWS